MSNERQDPQRKAARIVTLYQKVFDTAEGRVVLYDLMKKNFVLGSTFVPGDPDQTFVHEGQRTLVLWILTMLKTDPAKFLQNIENQEDSHVD